MHQIIYCCFIYKCKILEENIITNIGYWLKKLWYNCTLESIQLLEKLKKLYIN